ncbi:unnamed protein product, partial [Symbiodinium sp. CCMP2592]
ASIFARLKHQSGGGEYPIDWDRFLLLCVQEYRKVVVPQETADGEPHEASDGDDPSDGRSSDDGRQAAETEECESSAAVAQGAGTEDGAAEIASVEELLAQIDNTSLEQEQLRELRSPDEACALRDTVGSEQDEASDGPGPSDGRSSDDGRETAATEECERSAHVATSAVVEEGAQITSMEAASLDAEPWMYALFRKHPGEGSETHAKKVWPPRSVVRRMQQEKMEDEKLTKASLTDLEACELHKNRVAAEWGRFEVGCLRWLAAFPRPGPTASAYTACGVPIMHELLQEERRQFLEL